MRNWPILKFYSANVAVISIGRKFHRCFGAGFGVLIQRPFVLLANCFESLSDSPVVQAFIIITGLRTKYIFCMNSWFERILTCRLTLFLKFKLITFAWWEGGMAILTWTMPFYSMNQLVLCHGLFAVWAWLISSFTPQGTAVRS